MRIPAPSTGLNGVRAAAAAYSSLRGPAAETTRRPAAGTPAPPPAPPVAPAPPWAGPRPAPAPHGYSPAYAKPAPPAAQRRPKPPPRRTGRRRAQPSKPVHRAPATLPTWSEPAVAGGRLAGLDGIRALAVLAVIAYHAGLSWIPGGLLGVDAFFVLSGFLITTMLVAEWRRTGRIDLTQFWIRRGRRLLPALLLVLLAVAAFSWAFDVDKASLRLDALSALAYVANWRFALSDQGYFAHFSAPSPLLHLWSLGVEEQFYLLWPLLTLAVLRGRRRRRGHRALLYAAAGGAAASTLLLIILYAVGVGTSRLYYGTDTRAAALLVGAGLAAWRVARPAKPTLRARLLVQVGGLVGAAATLWAWLAVGGQSTFLYSGGFLLVALAVAAIVAAVVEDPAGPLGRALTLRPLPYLGRLSYGLYLWHWPVMLAVTHSRTHLGGVFLLALRLLITFGLAWASYTYVEMPIRTRRFRLPVPRLTTPVTVGGTALLVILATTGTSSAGDLDQIAAQQRHLDVSRLAAHRPVGPAAPRTVLVVGDSVAFTLARAISPPEQQRYGLSLLNAAQVGCGVAPGDLVVVPGGIGFPQAANCLQWPTDWAKETAVLHPSVAVLLVGRWEIADRRVNGRLTHIGQPAYDADLRANLLRAVDVLAGPTGATTVALATAPCFDSKELPDGSRSVQDDPARLAAYNSLVRGIAEQRPTQVRVLDLYDEMCAGGTYHRVIDSATIRDSDGVHFAKTPTKVLADLVLPSLRSIANAPKRAGGGR